MEEANSKSEGEKLMSSLLDLRKYTKKISKVILNEALPFPNAEHSGYHEQDFIDFEPPQPELCRVFLVVMDYDPHSLCITGTPDLELAVQSGEYCANPLDKI